MILLENAIIVTGEKEAEGSIVIDGTKIAEVIYRSEEDYYYQLEKFRNKKPQIWNLEGKHIIAGGIDAHVHFREPGLTSKADMQSESRAAAAGGVTSVMDMPNTIPPTTDATALKEKLILASGIRDCRISFHIGATNDNIEEVCRLVAEGDEATGITPDDIAGVKIFMGSSTGNMLVDDNVALERLFAIKEKPILVHCEDENSIRENLSKAMAEYGENIPFPHHEHIRSRQACIRSSAKALELAIKHGTKLTLCHISTKEEIEMVRAAKVHNHEITAETSCNYLWFCNEDYHRAGSRIKCNPSIKTADDRQALRNALAEGLIDTIGSDHAPHLLQEKDNSYCKAPSGLPSIQQSLPVLLTVANQENIPLTRIAAVFSEKASDIYGLKRGRIAKGYDADLVIFDYDKSFTVKSDDLRSKCRWSPYEGQTLKGVIETVLIDGQIIFNHKQH